MERDAEIRTLREKLRVRRDLRWSRRVTLRMPNTEQTEQAYRKKCYDGDSRLSPTAH